MTCMIPIEYLRAPQPGEIACTPAGAALVLAVLEDGIVVDLGDSRIQQYRAADVVA